MINELQTQFGKTDQIVFSAGRGGLSRITLTNQKNHTEAEIYLLGATVTSWRTAAKDLLFLSSKADFSGTKAIRGGIPVIFPQFAGGPILTHGFARTTAWQILSTEILSSGAPAITFGLTSSEQTKTIWPHDFSAKYTITLSDSLTTEVVIKNTGKTSFPFQLALHTYFAISDISQISITGLSGHFYIDKVRDQQVFTEDSKRLQICAETDRIYLDAPQTIALHDPITNQTLTIQSTGYTDAVIWNPWIEKCKSLKDLNEDDYKRFVCIESGQIKSPIVLNSGASATFQQIMKAN